MKQIVGYVHEEHKKCYYCNNRNASIHIIDTNIECGERLIASCDACSPEKQTRNVFQEIFGGNWERKPPISV